MDIRFISGNEFKIEEARLILSDSGINVIPYNIKIEELQTNESNKLIRDKVLKAFNIIGRPLFVEHTGLYIKYLNGFPGGLTQIFWDTLQADKFSELFKEIDNKSVTAKTTIGYCDGNKIHYFYGEIDGEISSEPRGNREFQWDCIFIPNGFDKTFAELSDRKNEISMRRMALSSFASYLMKGGK
ncbi:non-canonical purine NTP pyrophosphatase [Paenibacillus sp. sgz302251]|uniref:non-canonical purine NTP pyrophosphatase n=1 Tax=Paenibacillus sp. sgz302251 TaxID=3414493 RepID=UPI003C7C75FF